jgi:hypothetical protein
MVNLPGDADGTVEYPAADSVSFPGAHVRP